MPDILTLIKGKLVVSCQALPDEPLHSSFVMGKMAQAAKAGGAVAIRAQGIEDIIEIKKVTNLPIIGIIKKDYPDSAVYITPTKTEVGALLKTGCEMIALDVTLRSRPLGEKAEQLIEQIKSHNVLVMADISNVEEGLYAEKIGADCVSTTLSGYTDYTPQLIGPDFELIECLSEKLSIPVLAEGRINTPLDLQKVYACGAYSAVVGSAITRPQLIAAQFATVLKN